MKDKKGLFVVFEGIDGCGKTTQMHNLINHMEQLSRYTDVLRTHEPWKSLEVKRKLAEDRDAYSDATSMTRLFIEDRIDHTRELIVPNLKKGVFVFCDRYSLSTCAYQSAQGMNVEELIRMHENELILKPDVTFLVDVSIETATKRKTNRGMKSEKFDDFEFAE